MPYDTLPPAAAHRVELDGRERLIVSGVDVPTGTHKSCSQFRFLNVLATLYA